jgi:hypothetical protein
MPFSGGGSGSGSVVSVFGRSGAVVAATNDYTDLKVQNSPTNVLSAQGDILYASAANTLARLAKGTTSQILYSGNAPTWGAATQIGGSALIYRYTVAGADKASIDTGVDTPDAGSNDWTNGDLLEIYILARTDDAGATSNVNIILNNDTSAIYDTEQMLVNNATVSGGPGLAAANWRYNTHGSGGLANQATSIQFLMPDYAGTTFNKTGYSLTSRTDSTAANNIADNRAHSYRSTAAITRLKLSAAGGQKLKIGSQLLIYKRLAAAG